MSPSHVVVDGSNIATEGRSTPSLKQLDEAIREFQTEYPGTEVIVVVDATFGHRIAANERAMFDEAVAHGELVTPPAGAIGRGDAFVLRVAERVNAQVLSNDSFQEFHAEHPWLFDEGRLMGGKPVPGVGWIFTPRLPVRGPRSRAATGTTRGGRVRRDADGPARAPRSRGASKVAEAAIALAANEAAGLVTVVQAPDAPKVGDVIRVPQSGEVIKVAKAGRSAKGPAKAAKVTKAAKAAKEPATATKAAKATKATKAAKVTKAAKAVKEPATATKAAKATKETAKVTKAAKATKAATATKAKTTKGTAKATKAAKETTKVTRSAPAAKATKATKAAKEPAKSAPTTKATKATKAVRSIRLIKAAQDEIPAPVSSDNVVADNEVADERPTGRVGAGRRGRRGRGSGNATVQAAIEAATEEALGSTEVVTPTRPPRAPRGRSSEAAAPTAVNDPLTFLTFVTEHPLGSLVVGTVSSFVSHGAMVDVNGMSCYLPLTGLGDPPPRRAREVVAQGEERSFVVGALDPPRRGAELALPDRGRAKTTTGAAPVKGGSRRTRKAARPSG
jgi:hypothetical protein